MIAYNGQDGCWGKAEVGPRVILVKHAIFKFIVVGVSWPKAQQEALHRVSGIEVAVNPVQFWRLTRIIDFVGCP